MVKVIGWLVFEGYVEFLCGCGGGLCLVKEFIQISLGVFLCKFEEDKFMVECFGIDGGNCWFFLFCGLFVVL